MAKKNGRKDQKNKKRKVNVFLYLIGFLVLVAVLSFGAVLVALGMLPTFVASYVDNTEDRNHVRVVAACNFAGVVPFIADLFRKGAITSNNVYDLLFTPYVWMVMYGAAAFGWALVWFFPLAMHRIFNLSQDSAVRKLRGQQQDIVDEWGLEVETASRRALRNFMFSEERKTRKDGADAPAPQMPRLAGPRG